MKPDRITRVNELILRELGTQLYRVINRPDFNPAEVMFTKAETAVDLRTCRVGVSVRGTPAEQERVLGILRHTRADFQKAIRDNLIRRYTPHLHFVLDHAIEKGDNVLTLLTRMEAAGELPPADEEPPATSSDSDPLPE